MINSFDQMNIFKKKVLVEVAKKCYTDGIQIEDVLDIAFKIIPNDYPRVRCCIYKEREIIRERAFLAMGYTPHGQKPIEGQFLYVLDAACDDCKIHKVRITDNCQKCLFKACQNACKFDAIYEEKSMMKIDYDKCKACTMCAKACPYGSILVSDRPCHRVCPTGALIYNEGHIAEIDQSLCISCGQCQGGCPFGAISEISFIRPVIEDMKKGKEVVALVAPSILGQWGKANLNQIYSALHKIGFTQIVEVALGADITTKNEAEEAIKAKKENKKITTSCCPAFVSFIKQKYPNVYKENTSNVLSPMAIAGKIAREKYALDATICFIGPCVAKKAERLSTKNKSNIDYVLTFDEISAMMEAKGVNPIDEEDIKQNVESGSKSGHNFCFVGSVSKSLNDYLEETNEKERLSIKVASGPVMVAQSIKDLSKGKQEEDVLEGMMCEGGCIAGIGSRINNLPSVKSFINNENEKVNDVKINDASKKYSVNSKFEK